MTPDASTRTPPGGIVIGLTDDELAALPSVIDIRTAGRALGIGSKLAYRLASRGEFPVETFMIGTRRKVAKHKLLAHLGASSAA